MRWEQLLNITKTVPVFGSELLLAGNETPEALSKQLCLWVKAGKLSQIRRGWYSVSDEEYFTESQFRL